MGSVHISEVIKFKINNMKTLTKEQVNKKYAGKYIEFYKRYDYDKQIDVYEVRKTYSIIHENTTLGEDVGTSFEFTR